MTKRGSRHPIHWHQAYLDVKLEVSAFFSPEPYFSIVVDSDVFDTMVLSVPISDVIEDVENDTDWTEADQRKAIVKDLRDLAAKIELNGGQ